MRYLKEEPGNWGTMQGSDTVSVGNDMFALSDGCQLFYRFWRTGGPEVLVILHGLGGHSGWYIDLANCLAERGLNVYVVDHRGFGRSGGIPGHIARHQTYIDDIFAFITEVKMQHPDARLHVLGHSMGGIFATHLAVAHASALSSIILLNPWVIDRGHLPLTTTLRILLGGLFKSQKYHHVEGGHEGMTTNPEAIEMLLADPYWRREETATFLMQISLMRSALMKKARQVTVPTLVLQAEQDKAVVPEASRALYETFPLKDKQWIAYPVYSHDTEFEDEYDALIKDIVAWTGK